VFSHTGGEFEDPLVSKFQNASAFLDGMGRGLEGAGFEALANGCAVWRPECVFRHPSRSALSGAGGRNARPRAIAESATVTAIEAAARETILLLNDPMGDISRQLGKSSAETRRLHSMASCSRAYRFRL